MCHLISARIFFNSTSFGLVCIIPPNYFILRHLFSPFFTCPIVFASMEGLTRQYQASCNTGNPFTA